MAYKIDIDKLQALASSAEPSTRKFFQSIPKKQLKKLDSDIHRLHNEVFDEIDCLECANCCTSLGPRITELDVKRMGKALRMKPDEVIESYLRVDEDGDLVFKEMPCPFLAPDNYCLIYESRPKACREYPHTDRVKFYQIVKLSIKNTHTCPAVYEVFERLKKEKL